MDCKAIKAELLKMAKTGQPRPTWKSCELAKYIRDFTSKRSKNFDLEFSTELRKASPHWFVFVSKKERQEKRRQFQETLLELAKHGLEKPKGGDRKLSKLLWEYTNKKSKNYDFCFAQELAKIAPDWISCSKEEEYQLSKEKLLRLAAAGNPKPRWRDRSFGRLMQKFTLEKSPYYDEEFTQKLYQTAPHWFSDKGKNTKNKKKLILDLALSGKPRPKSKKSEDGKLIWGYTSPKSDRYDQKFAEQLKEIAPQWFVFPTSESKKATNEQEKEFLLSLAKSGSPRPNDRLKTKESKLLKKFTHQSSKSFDAHFKLELKKHAPHWFENLRGNKKERIKNLLIEMAREGKPKPTYRQDNLGKRLAQFTDKYDQLYDSEFTEEIKGLAPIWFTNKTDVDKDYLLSLAETGKPKPKIRNSSLGLKLSRFTNPKHACFDSGFNEKIRKLRPEWFVNPTILIKAKIYEMAMTGQPRPEKDSAIVKRLSEYMRVKSNLYDEIFAQKIKTLAPHWFRRGSNGKK